jgi:hypothetical protein
VVEALCCKPAGCGFENRCNEWFCFSICLILPTALGRGIYSASDRSEYLKHNNNIFRE